MPLASTYHLRSLILWNLRYSRQPGETAIYRGHRDCQARRGSSLCNFHRRANRPSEIANHWSECAVALLHLLHCRSSRSSQKVNRRLKSPCWHQRYRVDVPLRRGLWFRLELAFLHHHLRDLPSADAHSRDSCRENRTLRQSVRLEEGGAADAAR